MQNYKDLKVWEKSHAFTVRVYQVTRTIPREELYSLTNQLRRSASSVPANIAEGCGKNTKPEFAHFPNISLGSANEAEYLLLLAKDLTHLNIENFKPLTGMINEIKAMLISLIGKVRA